MLVWFTVWKTGCETVCPTVCTSHKGALLSDSTLLTNIKTGLHVEHSVILKLKIGSDHRHFLPPDHSFMLLCVFHYLVVQQVTCSAWLELYTGIFMCVWNPCLSGSGQERAARSGSVQGHHVDSAVHQKLLPVGERSAEPASLPGEAL